MKKTKNFTVRTAKSPNNFMTDILDYLNNSTNAFATVKVSKNMLIENGFLPYEPNVKAKVGGKYFIEKNGSAILAFKVGDLSHYAFNIALAHTDSPLLRVKGKKLLDSPCGKRVNVEAYGGLIRYSFMNIPLKLCGRLFVKSEEGLKTVLVDSDFNVNIPSLCIHHNPEVNEKALLTVQNDMLPLIGGKEDDLYKVLYGDGEIVDGDIFVAPAVKAFYSGADNEYICSPRIDNLTSCFSLLNGIIDCNNYGVSVACLYDNEEIGSHTKQGAYSDFLPSVLKRVNCDLGKTDGDYYAAIDSGFILSVDNGHAVHPAHPEKSDPSQKVYLNGGIVIKHHTNYSTDGYSSAVLKTILDNHGIKYQDYYNNSDIRCGGTLGLIESAKLQMNSVDIGLAQLAMHSSIETAGKNDVEVMIKCVKAFFESRFTPYGEVVTIK